MYHQDNPWYRKDCWKRIQQNARDWYRLSSHPKWTRLTGTDWWDAYKAIKNPPSEKIVDLSYDRRNGSGAYFQVWAYIKRYYRL